MSASLRQVLKVGIHVVSAVVWTWSLIKALATGKGWEGVFAGIVGHVIAANI